MVTGSCTGGQSSEDAGFFHLYHERRPRVHPLTIPRTMANAGASHIPMEFGITGPSFTVSTACASATHAIGQAFWLVRSGAVDMALAGGSEAPFSMGNPEGLGGAAGGVRRHLPAVLAEPQRHDPRRGRRHAGAGAARGGARTRGARSGARSLGFGMSSDAGHITQPYAEGAARAMRLALEDAQLAPEAIGYINAHGTGTAANDVTETPAIRAVFGGHADALAVSSTKAMHGHALGAAARARGRGHPARAARRRAAADRQLPGARPGVRARRDPEPGARPASVQYALSNSFAFGGMNAVLALGR